MNTATTIQTRQRAARRRGFAISERTVRTIERLSIAAVVASTLAMWAQIVLTGTITRFVAVAVVAAFALSLIAVGLEPSGEKGGAK